MNTVNVDTLLFKHTGVSFYLFIYLCNFFLLGKWDFKHSQLLLFFFMNQSHSFSEEDLKKAISVKSGLEQHEDK